MLAAALVPPISSTFSGGADLPVTITAYANEASVSKESLSEPPANTAEKTELKSENIKFEYLSSSYNGKPQKPKITVISGGKTLTEGTDFAVNYPADCINVGLKTVSVSGLGAYSGSFSATYRIEPLDVSKSDVKFTAEADPCTYNSFAQTPDFRVTANGIEIPDSDYTKRYSNNVNATNSAVCDLTFTGNFTGKRRCTFAISKAEHHDLDIEIPVNMAKANGSYEFTYDLSGLLPNGAYFGAPNYSIWDFPKDKPTVAFNELHCTVCEGVDSAVVGVPVLGADNYSGFSINFYFKESEKIFPELVIKPIIREYDGKSVTEDELAKAGCYAHVNGKIIEGRWIFWQSLSAEPHAAMPVVCTFQPDDPAYESVDGIAYVTVNKIAAPEISVRLSSSQVDYDDEPILTVIGVPEDWIDLLSIECSPSSDGFSYEEYPSKSGLKFTLTPPYERGIYTVTASLPEDEHHFSASASAEINVGNYVPPEQQIPDKITTEDELAKLIAAAPSNGFAAAQGMRSLSSANLKAAAQKRLTLEVKLNDTYTWVLQTSKLPENPTPLDLELGTAVIPSVLTEKLGGTAANSFTVTEKNFGNAAELRVTLKDPKKDKYANLFYYNSAGELEFSSCARIEADNTVKLPVTRSGKYIIITDNETMLFGDINNDGKFSLDDLREFLYIYANGLSTPDKLGKHDINGDGKLSLNDLIELLNIYVNRS